MSPETKKPNPIDIHVGTRIRMRRNLLGMSQTSLGDALGLTFQQVQKYEKGTNRVGASRMQMISKILNVPISFFFEGAPGGVAHEGDTIDFQREPEIVTEFIGTKEGLQLNRAFSAIQDKKVRQKIIELVSALGSED